MPSATNAAAWHADGGGALGRAPAPCARACSARRSGGVNLGRGGVGQGGCDLACSAPRSGGATARGAKSASSPTDIRQLCSSGVSAAGEAKWASYRLSSAAAQAWRWQALETSSCGEQRAGSMLLRRGSGVSRRGASFHLDRGGSCGTVLREDEKHFQPVATPLARRRARARRRPARGARSGIEDQRKIRGAGLPQEVIGEGSHGEFNGKERREGR